MSNKLINKVRGVRKSGRSGAMTLLVSVPIAVITAAIVASIFSRRQDKGYKPRGIERKVDDALKQTFPASDPPASQYFDIPANRQ